MKPGEHKTVQARILEYAEAIGWMLVSREEAEQRRGFEEKRERDLILIDYDDPAHNVFEVTEEWIFHNGHHGTRQDVICLPRRDCSALIALMTAASNGPLDGGRCRD